MAGLPPNQEQTQTQGQTQTQRIFLGKTDRPLNVASFAKPVSLPPQQEVKRRLPGERRFFRRYKSSKKTQFRFNFEKRPDQKDMLEVARESTPWDLKLGTVDYRGKPDPIHKNLVLIVNQGSDWKFFLCDKWYNFAIPPKPTTQEEMDKDKPQKNYFGRLSRIMGEGKTEKAEEEKADEPDVRVDEGGHESAPEEDFEDDQKRDGEQDIDWDFDEKVDDDEGVESPGVVEDDKEFKFEEEEDENTEEVADKKKLDEEEKKNLKKMLKEVSKKEDMTFFFGPEEDSDDEFAEEDDDDEFDTKEDATTPITPQESGKRKMTTTEGDQAQAKKPKTEGGAGSGGAGGAESDPNLLTEDEVQRFLRAPATIKEIKLKFDPRVKQDKRNKELLHHILKKIAEMKTGDGEPKFFLKQQ